MGWKSQKILFVTGKGGVGKSLIAAGVARAEAARGRRVLLAELGENSYYKDFWKLDGVDHVPRPVPGEGFDLALWSGESCLREYVLHYLRVESLYRLFFENKVMRSLVNVAPGLSEIAILGKITSGIRKVGPPLAYDLVVVDAFATGHALAMFRAPRGMMEAIRFGPMGHHSRDIQKVIQDPGLTGYLVVTLLEELPVVETLELRDALKAELGVDAELAANKIVPLPASRAELRELRDQARGGLKELSGFLLGVEERQARFLGQLLDAGAEVHRVPQVYSEKPDELVKRVASAFSGSGADGL